MGYVLSFALWLRFAKKMPALYGKPAMLYLTCYTLGEL